MGGNIGAVVVIAESGDHAEQAQYGGGATESSDEHRTAAREIRLQRSEGAAPWWLETVVGIGMALCLVSGPVMFATRIWAIGLLAMVGFAVMMLGQHGIAERRRRYMNDPVSRGTIAVVLAGLADVIASRVIDQHRSWAARAGRAIP